jgi:chromosome segregation ATPase
MEAQIREELESEYMTKQEEMIASYGNENISDLESKLREELLQVKGERERWKSEQEDLMKRVRESQKQFESVREGFKSTSFIGRCASTLTTLFTPGLFPLTQPIFHHPGNFVSTSTEKLEKEKNRCKELEREKEGQEIVIEKLSEEYHDAMNELNQLQAQEEARMQSLLEKEKSSLIQQHLKQIEDSVRREEEYTLQIRKLRNEIEELLNEQTSHMHEQNRWEEEKQSLLARCNEKDDEIRRAMDDLEELNSENADYLQKIEVYTNSMDSFEESRVKYR